MSDNDQDSGSPAGTSGTTNAAGSQGQSVQPGSIDAAKLQTAVEALTRRLDEVDARSKSLQGDKDRGVNKTQKEVDDLKRKLAEYEKLKAKGFDVDDAAEEMDFREAVRTLKELAPRLAPVPAPAAGNSQSATDPTAQLISELKLDSNDAGVLKIVAETLDPIQRAAKLGAYKATLVPHAPDPSAAPALQSQPAVHAPDQSALIAKVNEWQLNPSAHKDDLAKAYKELGWG